MLDNLREGVLVPDIYDSSPHPLYRDVLAHYGAVALPCRIKDPDRRELRCFTPRLPAEASLFSCANFAHRI